MLSRLLTYAGLLLAGALMILPLLWMISTSLKASGAVFTYPPEFIPREQEAWTHPATGEELPLFTLHDRPGQVALLRFLPEEAEVIPLDDGQKARPPLRIPRYVVRNGRQVDNLVPVKHMRLHWENYPAAWTAIKLQHNWMAFEIPYALRFRLGGRDWQIGPWGSRGIRIVNAFTAFYLNSLIVALAVTLGTLITSALAAFAFARLEFRGRDPLFLGYLGTLMVPYVVTMIPIFALLKLMNLIDTYFAMVVPVMFSAYGTFLLRQFFLAIPHDLEDAARLDGCGNLGVLRHVILPLSRPALATLGTFTFLGTWNSFMWPLIVMNSTEKMPLTLGLYAFLGQYTADWNLMMAAAVMVMAPVVLIFLLGQRYFIEGILLSGMKS
ncbi:MAG: carbohydrate ABC transporter permease [candidate division WS1 bacterium]|nr:carbohydrate ABC transporter permease [candidate division WS1 bacterium]